MCAFVPILLAASALVQGYNQKQMNEFQADEANYQARVERDTAKAEAEKIRAAKERQRGMARAALAGSGVDVGEGTAVDIDKDIATRYEEDAFTSLLNGDRRGRALNAQGSQYRMAGRNAMTAGVFNAATSVLGSMAKSGWGS